MMALKSEHHTPESGFIILKLEEWVDKFIEVLIKLLCTFYLGVFISLLVIAYTVVLLLSTIYILIKCNS